MRLMTERADTFTTGTLSGERVKTHAVPSSNLGTFFPSGTETTHVEGGRLATLEAEEGTNRGCTPHQRSDRIF